MTAWFVLRYVSLKLCFDFPFVFCRFLTITTRRASCHGKSTPAVTPAPKTKGCRIRRPLTLLCRRRRLPPRCRKATRASPPAETAAMANAARTWISTRYDGPSPWTTLRPSIASRWEKRELLIFSGLCQVSYLTLCMPWSALFRSNSSHILKNQCGISGSDSRVIY